MNGQPVGGFGAARQGGWVPVVLKAAKVSRHCVLKKTAKVDEQTPRSDGAPDDVRRAGNGTAPSCGRDYALGGIQTLSHYPTGICYNFNKLDKDQHSRAGSTHIKNLCLRVICIRTSNNRGLAPVSAYFPVRCKLQRALALKFINAKHKECFSKSL